MGVGTASWEPWLVWFQALVCGIVEHIHRIQSATRDVVCALRFDQVLLSSWNAKPCQLFLSVCPWLLDYLSVASVGKLSPYPGNHVVGACQKKNPRKVVLFSKNGLIRDFEKDQQKKQFQHTEYNVGRLIPNNDGQYHDHLINSVSSLKMRAIIKMYTQLVS